MRAWRRSLDFPTPIRRNSFGLASMMTSHAISQGANIIALIYFLYRFQPTPPQFCHFQTMPTAPHARRMTVSAHGATIGRMRVAKIRCCHAPPKSHDDSVPPSSCATLAARCHITRTPILGAIILSTPHISGDGAGDHTLGPAH